MEGVFCVPVKPLPPLPSPQLKMQPYNDYVLHTVYEREVRRGEGGRTVESEHTYMYAIKINFSISEF